MISNIFAFWQDLLDPLKCTFDGENKLIYVNPKVSVLYVKKDIYSAAKRWILRDVNARYEMPIRSIGGDVISPGVTAGEIYFLTNGYQIVANQTVKVFGVLYHDDPTKEVFIGTGGVTLVVSNIVTGYTMPTPQQIATAVWDKPVTTTEGSFGQLLANKVLTVVKFLGLK
jgi:hypothetical protein